MAIDLTAHNTAASSGARPASADPAIRRIDPSDLRDSLQKGLDDFLAMPSHMVFLGLIYPIVGIFFARLALGFDMLPLVFPLAAGFTLIGPVAAIGLYELSRRREKGLPATWRHAFNVLRSRSLPTIGMLAALLLAIFVAWLVAAQTIYRYFFGDLPPLSATTFAYDVFFTQAGWNMILVGNMVGFLFAVAVFAISAVSFPLLIDRNVGFAAAVTTSVRAVIANPGTMALWAMIVAGLLAVGSLPFLLGLTIVVPILGHATWHLYRKLIEPGSGPRPGHRPRIKGRRYAADFPSNLVPWFKGEQR